MATALLELNEGQAVHSLYRPGSLPHRRRTGTATWCCRSRPSISPPRRVAILGNGAGTTARAYGHFFPRARVDGVEIDPELEEVGRRYFDLGEQPEPDRPQRGRPAVASPRPPAATT